MDGMMEEKKGFRLDQTRDTTSLWSDKNNKLCALVLYFFPHLLQITPTMFTNPVTYRISTETQICSYTLVPLLGYGVFIQDKLLNQTGNENKYCTEQTTSGPSEKIMLQEVPINWASKDLSIINIFQYKCIIIQNFDHFEWTKPKVIEITMLGFVLPLGIPPQN